MPRVVSQLSSLFKILSQPDLSLPTCKVCERVIQSIGSHVGAGGLPQSSGTSPQMPQSLLLKTQQEKPENKEVP